MKIYAIRDKLINYYMTPFAAESDKAVLAGIAQAVNNLEENSAISKAPHHFEIWHLAVVTEDGGILPDKYLVADANSLIRPVQDREALTRSAIKRTESPLQRTSDDGDTRPAVLEN